MPRSLHKIRISLGLWKRATGGTDIYDDGDTVGEGEVAAEFTLHHIEVLRINTRGLERCTIGTGSWRPPGLGLFGLFENCTWQPRCQTLNNQLGDSGIFK